MRKKPLFASELSVVPFSFRYERSDESWIRTDIQIEEFHFNFQEKLLYTLGEYYWINQVNHIFNLDN